MTDPKVTEKQAAIVEDLDAADAQEIYTRLGLLVDKRVRVELDVPNGAIRLVFSDGSTLDLGMTPHMPVLEAVTAAGGIILVYAVNPGPAPTNGGPPLPDMMCPCGGP